MSTPQISDSAETAVVDASEPRAAQPQMLFRGRRLIIPRDVAEQYAVWMAEAAEQAARRAAVRVRLSTARGKGRCVRANVPIKRGELIEVVPTLLFKHKDVKGHLSVDIAYPHSRTMSVIPLGLGSIYNHSYAPNARYTIQNEKLTMRFYARRDIRKGEEITVNYNGDPDDKSPVWFDVK